MIEILFLCYPKCGTCRKAQKWLKENKIDVTYRDISIENPDKKELKSWIHKSGLPASNFFNTSGKIYKENNLKEKVKSKSEDELIALLATDGMLVKRPVLVTDKFVLVGFNEDSWKAYLK